MLQKWHVKNQKTKFQKSQMQWNQISLLLLTNLWSDLLYIDRTLWNAYLPNLVKSRVHRKKQNPGYSRTLDTEFKFNYTIKRVHNLSKNTQSFKPVIASTANDIKLLNQFKMFLKINISTSTPILVPHFSFRHFYMGYTRGGLTILNIPKLFTKWKNTYYLLFNLSYHELESLIFTTSFFKSEALALNWNNFHKIKFMWRYTQPFLFFKPSKITDHGDLIYYRLNLLGLRTAIITDIIYHHKTIYYLHRSRFYTVGLVPTNHHIKSVNFAVPTGHDSILTQLFFIRFLVNIKKHSDLIKYNQAKQIWKL